MFLYHATDAQNVDSILTDGLLLNPPSHNWNGMDCENKIFLAFDPNVATEFFSSSDNSNGRCAVLRINFDMLTKSAFSYDWNNRCEFYKDIKTCVYNMNIPSSAISVCNSTEVNQTIFDFEGTEMFDIIMRTFEEEVETNMEE